MIMKYLRWFNENINISTRDIWEKELEEFCNNHLADFVDNGNEFSLDKDMKYTNIEIYKNNDIKDYDTFKWKDLKDDIIPFLQMLSNEFNVSSGIDFYLKEVEFEGSRKVAFNHIIDKNDVINDNIDDIIPYNSKLSDCKIYYISINVIYD